MGADQRACPLFYPTWFLPGLSLLERCRRISEAGFEGASFAVGVPADMPQLNPFWQEALAHIRDGLIEMGLDRSLHVVTSNYQETTADVASGAAMLRGQVETCVSALSGPGLPPLIVTFHVPLEGPQGYGDEPWLSAEYTDELVGFIGYLQRSYGVRAGIENLFYPVIGAPDALGRFLERCPDGVGVLLDSGHVNLVLPRDWCPHASMAEFVEALAAPVIEVHLHDNHGETDEHLMPGQGTADLHGMLDAVFASGLEGPITIECDLEAEGRPGLAAGLARIRAAYGLGI